MSNGEFSLEAYAEFVGPGTIDELRLLGERLRGRRVQNVNSTAVGGGVAEILNRLVPLLREVGVDVRWDVMQRWRGLLRRHQTAPQRAPRRVRHVHVARLGGLRRHRRRRTCARST